MATQRSPSKSDVARALAESSVAEKSQRAAPTWAEMQAAFPDARIIDHPDGTRTCRIEDTTPGKRRLRLLNEMFRPKGRLDAEAGQNRHARTREVVMRDPSGRLRHVPEQHEERVAKKLGARRARPQRNYSTWRDREGRKWIQWPGESEWRLESNPEEVRDARHAH